MFMTYWLFFEREKKDERENYCHFCQMVPFNRCRCSRTYSGSSSSRSSDVGRWCRRSCHCNYIFLRRACSFLPFFSKVLWFWLCHVRIWTEKGHRLLFMPFGIRGSTYHVYKCTHTPRVNHWLHGNNTERCNLWQSLSIWYRLWWHMKH